MSEALARDVAYRVVPWSGVAFRLVEEHGDGTVDVVMIGDDRTFTVPAEDLTPLDEDAYCRECGQIGCGHG